MIYTNGLKFAQYSKKRFGRVIIHKRVEDIPSSWKDIGNTLHIYIDDIAVQLDKTRIYGTYIQHQDSKDLSDKVNRMKKVAQKNYQKIRKK